MGMRISLCFNDDDAEIILYSKLYSLTESRKQVSPYLYILAYLGGRSISLPPPFL